MKEKQVKFYYVYLIINLILNKPYVGSRVCYKDKIEDDDYWGTSKYLNKDYKIYGIENFTKEIIKTDYTNIKDMLIGESFYMHEYNTFEPSGYNRYDPGKNPGWHMGGKIAWNKGISSSEETKQKISNSLKGKPKSQESRENYRLANIGEKNPMYGRTGESHPRFGKKMSLENKEFLKNLYLNKTFEEIHGEEKTKEIKNKLSLSLIGKNRGKVRSEISKKAISETLKKYWINKKAKLAAEFVQESHMFLPLREPKT